MPPMDFPQSQERRDIRYPLHLPVSLKLAHKEVHARSENISLGGILLSSTFLIPEGSTVDVAVRVAVLPDPGSQLSARGRVLRVQPKASGDFAVAIAFEHPAKLVRHRLDSSSESHGEGPRSSREKNSAATNWPLGFAHAWHTET
jgi:PilZ domain-containing protein